MRVAVALVAGAVGISCLLSACEAEDDGLLVGGGPTDRNRKTAAATPTPPPSNPADGKGNVDQTPSDQNPGTQNPGTQNPGTQDPGTQNPGTQNPGTQDPDPDVPLLPFGLNPTQVALTVPPNSGAPIFPTTAQAEASLDGKKVTPLWSSSDARVATVDATGRISAVGAGSATITASYQGRQVSLPVTVDQKSRLKVTAKNAPFDTSVGLRVYDGAGNQLATGGEGDTFDLSGSVNLSVEARRSGALVGLGRWDGLTLSPNQLNTRAVPMNVPELYPDTPNGGPGRELIFFGSGFSKWKKGQGATEVDWEPERLVTIWDQAATVTYVNASQIRVLMPQIAGQPALRKAVVSVGGLSLQGHARLIGSLSITTPSTPMSVGEERVFTVRALDTNQQEVGDPSVKWELMDEGSMGGGFGDGTPIGEMSPSGSLKAERAGTGTIVVRSGTLMATASVTVE